MATCNSTALAFWNEADKTQWLADKTQWWAEAPPNTPWFETTHIQTEQVTSPAVYGFKEFVSANSCLTIAPDDTLGNNIFTIAHNISTEPTLVFYKEGKEHVKVDKDGVVTGKFDEIDQGANYFYSSIINLGIKYQALQEEYAKLLEDRNALIDKLLERSLVKEESEAITNPLSNAIDRINVNGMHAPMLSIIENS
jgi:hypothetical protein